MFTVLSNTRNSNLYLIVVLAITVFVIFGFAIAPSIAAPKPAVIIPVTGNEDAYLEYLRGEKVMYTNPLELNNALIEYHAGEKVLYDLNSAVWAHHIGEKSATLSMEALNIEDALLLYRLGEKSATLSMEALNIEDALLLYRLGEKGIK